MMNNFYMFLLAGSLLIGQLSGPSYAQNNWKQEFAEVCGKTQNAMDLSTGELHEYLDRCDKLEQRIAELNGQQGSERKVYAKRLKMCRELYVFALEHKEQQETENNKQ